MADRTNIDIDHLLMIIGVGRSGTTLLQAVLNAHPYICFPPESHFIRNFVINPDMQTIYEQKGLSAVEDALNHDRFVQRLNIETQEALEPFKINEEPFSFGNLFKRYLYLYAKRQNKRCIVGEKDPANLYHLTAIKHVFPQARIIHIIRDPRDVVLSRLNSDEISYGKSVGEWSFNYRRGLITARQEGRRLFGDNYYEVYYEDLVTNTEDTLKSLCRQIGISFDMQMLSFQNKAQEIVASDERKWKKNVTRPIMANNVGKWKKYLSKKQIITIEVICSNVFREAKYTRSNIPRVYLLFNLLQILFLYIISLGKVFRNISKDVFSKRKGRILE